MARTPKGQAQSVRDDVLQRRLREVAFLLLLPVVVYLFACFRMWSLMRWRFPRFIMLALGGVIPFLSFFMEARVARDVKAYLAAREASAASAPAPEGVR